MPLSQTFHQFPLLPNELQIQILNYAIYSIPARSITIIPSTINYGDLSIARTDLSSDTVSTIYLPPITYSFPGAPPTTTPSHKLKIQPQDAQTSLLALLALSHLSRTLTLQCYSPAFADFFDGRYVYVRKGDRIAVRGWKDERMNFFARGYLRAEERKERSERCIRVGIEGTEDAEDAEDEGEWKFRVEASMNRLDYWSVCWGGDE
jgi:hypothetical protein